MPNATQSNATEAVPCSKQAQQLVSDLADASFECGNWRSENDDNYEDLRTASATAQSALHAYIANLEAQLAAVPLRARPMAQVKQAAAAATRAFQESLANAEFEAYDFGDDVAVEDFGGWDTTDANDWIRIAYIRYDEDHPERETRKVSFHVTFSSATAIGEVYALLCDCGNFIGKRGQVTCQQAA